MSRYGFVVSAVKNRLSGGKAAYAARMRHMDVIRGEQLFKEFGEYMAMNPTLAKNLVNGLGGYIKEQLLHGYKLEFIINEDVPVGRYRLFIGSRSKGQTAVATDSVPVEIVAAPE